MQRINLGKPYEDFIAKMIQSGYYGTATEVIRDALRDKMAKAEDNRIAQIHSLIEEAEVDFKNGRTVEFTPTLLDEIYNEAMKQADSKGNLKVKSSTKS